MDWSLNGEWLPFFAMDQQDLWVLPLSGNREPIPFAQTPFIEFGGQLSPDNRWMAYRSDESGQPQIYVASFPSGGKWPVSASGGTDPLWRADGKELFYLALDGNLMAVDIEADGDTPVAGTPHTLFLTKSPRVLNRYSFDVSADGQRFLVNSFVEDAVSAPITWVLNWTAELQR